MWISLISKWFLQALFAVSKTQIKNFSLFYSIAIKLLTNLIFVNHLGAKYPVIRYNFAVWIFNPLEILIYKR